MVRISDVNGGDVFLSVPRSPIDLANGCGDHIFTPRWMTTVPTEWRCIRWRAVGPSSSPLQPDVRWMLLASVWDTTMLRLVFPSLDGRRGLTFKIASESVLAADGHMGRMCGG